MTKPLLVQLAGEVIVIQLLVLSTVQEHPKIVVTLTCPALASNP